MGVMPFPLKTNPKSGLEALGHIRLQLETFMFRNYVF